MKYYVVDAFSDEVFKGNPAGVCVLDNPIDGNTMQKIAEENNLSETAFVIKNKSSYDLRWFTPKAEIDLCGHATLGTSYVISNYVDIGIESMSFNTASGILEVRRNGDLYEMDFPLREVKKVEVSYPVISQAIGIKPAEIYLSRDLFIVLESEEQVKRLVPNFSEMLKLNKGLGVIATAKGTDVDFVSRCFYPKLGVNEDPVTGSAHSNLIPFWSQKLNKDIMTAKQLSKRGGILYCKMNRNRVEIGGKAVLYMKGNINV
ncbi:PhzF family phenazine biosynthesis protein [Clostridium kluyveri]|uniref:Phenazine biosynthesis protein n=1 Tax=Clostridium kluyveri TaxID=1534 RepID=A0A1L5FA31_CLOKL|nr:PhzF family phenazine biosynthesis protein [Clostridium kluyveri]APM39864.1 phenazine biosynthesis protein [Clostridium kluyveri]